MAFTRGLDVKESLRLGKFSTMTKDLRELFEKSFVKRDFGGIIWATWKSDFASDLIRSSINAIECKNMPSPNGNNVNKFFLFLEFGEHKHIGDIKDITEMLKWQISTIFGNNNCNLKNIIYSLREKNIRKAGFPVDKSCMLIEFTYITKK